MTYCVGVLLNDGLVFASDSRTHAGVDNFAKFCKLTVFERPGDRVIVMLSSGGLAGTQAIVSVLKQEGRTVEATYYPQEGHGFLKRENQIDALEQTVRWFDRYLKGEK